MLGLMNGEENKVILSASLELLMELWYRRGK
jgi:hypothetical protein